MASEGSGSNNITGELTHGGKYTRYNLYGSNFEVSSKYVPSDRPLLGRGSYGVVCAATNTENNNEKVAIKKILNAFDNIIRAKRTLREIKILRHLDHDNIIAIRDVIRPPKRDDFNDVYIVSEVMDTDLDQIIQSGQPLEENHCQYFIYQVLRGLKYIHSANVLHRDIKPSNLFLNANCELKIGDFGFARTIPESNSMTEVIVSLWYRAPELLLNCSQYTSAIDVWSVGCVLAELITRKPILQGHCNTEQIKLVTELLGTPDEGSFEFVPNNDVRTFLESLPIVPKQQLSEKLPNMCAEALDLLEKMLVFDPNQRITVDEALSHKYLSSYRDIDNEPICSRPLSFLFEQPLLTEEDIKELIWQESLEFNPDDPVP